MTDLALTGARAPRRLTAEAAAPVHAFDRGLPLAAGQAATVLPRAEWRPLAALAEIGDAWRALARRALEPNVFYEPAFALPAAAVFGHDAGAVLVWSESGPAARLIGFFPARIERRRYGPLLPVLAGWIYPFAPLGLPLVDREHAPAAIAAWLDGVAAHSDLPSLLRLPLLPTESTFMQLLREALAARDAAMVPLASQRRALLKPAGDRANYLAAAMSAKKRKDLARQRRRLGEDGNVDFSMVSQPAALPAALADFLALEAAGWKGRARTAAAQDATLRQFIEQAACGLATDQQIAVARLSLGERTLAAGIVLRSGDTAWFWKIAYDESVARASPGVQVALDLTNALLADDSLVAADFCAVPDHPMIDHLWRERLDLADQLIALGPAARRAVPVACAIERARSATIAAAKWARRRLRGR